MVVVLVDAAAGTEVDVVRYVSGPDPVTGRDWIVASEDGGGAGYSSSDGFSQSIPCSPVQQHAQNPLLSLYFKLEYPRVPGRLLVYSC